MSRIGQRLRRVDRVEGRDDLVQDKVEANLA